MKIEIFQVDAFASKVFEGNPAAVCPLNTWLPDEILQHIAAENNLSETAFVVPENHGYRIRWFTPNAEVDLCGHATLAAAHVIFTRLHHPRDTVLLHSKSGELRVAQCDSRYQLDFPALPYKHVPLSDELLAGLTVQPDALYASTFDLLCVFKDEEIVFAANPNLAVIASWPYRGVILTAPSSRADVYSRCFYPKVGVAEDPVTGSAHCVIAPYWSAQLQKVTLRALQGLKRQGQLECTVQEDRVLLTGQCHLYLEGVIYLPV